MIPLLIPMRVSLSDFWNMTPKEFYALSEGIKIEKERKDEEMYTQALYFKRAFEVVMAHFGAGLAGKKSDAEFFKKPFLVMAKEKQNETIENQVQRQIYEAQAWAIALRKNGLPPSPYQ
jgi:hypothetical protein